MYGRDEVNTEHYSAGVRLWTYGDHVLHFGRLQAVELEEEYGIKQNAKRPDDGAFC